MQITIELDEKLLAAAQSYTNLNEPSAAINAAMTGFIQREAALALARLGGSQPQLKRIPRRRMPQ